MQLWRPWLHGRRALHGFSLTQRDALRSSLSGRMLDGICSGLAGAVKQTSLGVQSVPFHIADLQHGVRFIRGLKKTKTATQTTQWVIQLFWGKKYLN